MKLREERSFSLRHTAWYSVYYFLIIQTVLQVLVIVLAFLFGDLDIEANIDINSLPVHYLFLSYAIGLFLFYVKSIGVLRTHLDLFLQTFKENYVRLLIDLFVMLVSVMTVNYAVSMISGVETSGNQTEIVALAKSAPVFVIFLTLIFAPLVEELLFRGGYYLSLTRGGMSQTKATIISAVSFGFLHVLGSLFVDGQFMALELLHIIPYSLLGYFFVRAVQRNGNIWDGIALHFLNNLVSVLALFISLR